jgi:hypothetical protein
MVGALVYPRTYKAGENQRKKKKMNSSYWQRK